jgi:hypothetical protein
MMAAHPHLRFPPASRVYMCVGCFQCENNWFQYHFFTTSVLLGAQHILAIDVDPLALHQAQQNIAKLDAATNTAVDFIQAKPKYIPSSNINNKNKHQRGRSNRRLNLLKEQSAYEMHYKALGCGVGDMVILEAVASISSVSTHSTNIKNVCRCA